MYSDFCKLRNSLSIMEKVDLILKLHNDNYYLGKSMKGWKITFKHYNSIISAKAQNKLGQETPDEHNVKQATHKIQEMPK